MIVTFCPECNAKWKETPCDDWHLSIKCCDGCAEKRRAALHRQGVGGQSCTDEMEDKMTVSGAIGGSSGQNNETRQMVSGARCGRVVRKSTPMS
jgi:hypothetical protein